MFDEQSEASEPSTERESFFDAQGSLERASSTASEIPSEIPTH